MAKDTMNLITDKAQSPAPIVESSQLSTPPPSATTLGWPTEEGDEDAPPHFLLLSSILSQEEDAPYSTPLTSNPQFANTLTCPLCKGSRRRGRRRKFKSAAALQAHLDEMGAHLPEPYVYPGSKRRFITLGSLIRHAEDKVKEGGEEGRVAEEVVGCARGWLEGLCGERVRGWRDRAVYAGDNDDGGGDDGGAEDDGTEDEQEDGEDGGVIWGVSEGV
ncbi:hypothetical protein L873DRAFT_1788853 [Choiromyces venosus 120613-1]|uniref:Uncharacterized protein n=1 Tax=Choiromyces venosus 120613-1 TaxID=1336337 RepID=A0A3N4JTZ6_9PEZI|nr:hypothetical protein L873DRAFT_1788853 [Choiromyces venosus 120613-1]